MDFSFLGLNISFNALFIILIAILVLLFLTQSYLNDDTNMIIESDNEMAKNLLIGAIIATIILFIMVLFMSFSRSNEDQNIFSFEIVNDLKYGFGSFFLISIGFILFATIIALSFYALSYIINNTARILVIIAGSLAAFCIIPFIIILYYMISYNIYLNKLVIKNRECIDCDVEYHNRFPRNNWDAENKFLYNRSRIGTYNVDERFD